MAVICGAISLFAWLNICCAIKELKRSTSCCTVEARRSVSASNRLDAD